MAKFSRNHLFILAAALLVWVGGCMWNLPLASPSESARYARMSPPPGKGLLYVLRDDQMEGGGVMTRVYLDGDGFGTVKGGAFLVAAVAPGIHEIKTSLDNTTTIPVEVKAGERHYVLHQIQVNTHGNYMVRLNQITLMEGKRLADSYQMSLKNEFKHTLK